MTVVYDGSSIPVNAINNQFEVRAVPIRLHIKKNRNGPVGVSDPILWDKAINTFGLLANEDGGDWNP